ncbi:DUF2975 domain-containing protein [Corynebacterium suedekumii]|uniref:DUF2975 domain-containing protein n=1 Tax=Corynebacterium suedekumii TaxID=3049801 RepID=A0ABY8VPW1_9CORY|nr:DUF2975 domain-containing protein [Corynebacterium suedekumii]WIM69605.1 DUF2975 domain-containing protein [Corynebacterium suedekumii]
MSPTLVALLRGILVLGGLAGLAVQVLVAGGLILGEGTVPLAAWSILAVIIVLGLACLQFSLYCIWRLLGLVREGTVFSPAALGWVDRIIGAIVGGAVAVLVAGYIVAEVDDAPGLILVATVVSLLIGGVALVVYVQRALLMQATGFSTELEGVI